MNHAEYLAHDATALAERVRRHEVSPGDLLDLALAQLSRVQPRVNAVVHDMQAQARSQIAGGLQGPLAGVPFLLKDGLQDYAGVPTAVGSAALRHAVPRVHAATTRRFLQAGLVVFGKTNLPELGLKGVSDSRAFGAVSNPWDVSRNAGGSSGGAAAAVAAGVLPMAAGSDGGGSLRIPGSWCGLFTLKPSRGRVSEGPAVGEVWFGACTHGVLSRSVRDCALALDLLCGPEPGDPFVVSPSPGFVPALQQAVPRLRIGWSVESPVGTPVHPEGVAAVERAVPLLQQLGHDVRPAAPGIDGRALARSYVTVYFATVAAEMAQAQAQAGARESDFEPLTRLLGSLGRGTPAVTLATELMRWNEFARALGDFHRGFDLLLTPVTAVPALRHGEADLPPWQERVLGLARSAGLLRLLAGTRLVDGIVDAMARDSLAPYPFTQLANLTGTPAMSVPLHHTADGLPMGVQFVGRPGEEALMLQLAAQLERAAPWFDRLPALARV